MTQFGNCLYTNGEIKKLFITKWTSDVICNINSGYTITSVTGLTSDWSEIKIDTVSVLFEQTMNPPNPNGINYTESLNIVIPNTDISKWLDLVNILVDRYIIVFQDANDHWFILGWRFGTKVESYSVDEGQYLVGFLNSFSNSLLATISESYVNSNIL